MSAMTMATVGILSQWFPLIPDEFWHGTSCIEKVMSLSFYGNVERQKGSPDAILASVLVWMRPCYSSQGHDDVIMPLTTVSILFYWFPLILDEFWHVTSCIENVISFPFYAYVECQKWSPMWFWHPFEYEWDHVIVATSMMMSSCPWLL
jgi:hypothetical protein